MKNLSLNQYSCVNVSTKISLQNLNTDGDRYDQLCMFSYITNENILIKWIWRKPRKYSWLNPCSWHLFVALNRPTMTLSFRIPQYIPPYILCAHEDEMPTVLASLQGPGCCLTYHRQLVYICGINVSCLPTARSWIRH